MGGGSEGPESPSDPPVWVRSFAHGSGQRVALKPGSLLPWIHRPQTPLLTASLPPTSLRMSQPSSPGAAGTQDRGCHPCLGLEMLELLTGCTPSRTGHGASEHIAPLLQQTLIVSCDPGVGGDKRCPMALRSKTIPWPSRVML